MRIRTWGGRQGRPQLGRGRQGRHTLGRDKQELQGRDSIELGQPELRQLGQLRSVGERENI